MLFPFDPPRPASFWMRNTLIPLDMIFIRPDGSIARIAANTVPMSETPVAVEEPMTAVLELRGGQGGRARHPRGDRVSWRRLGGLRGPAPSALGARPWASSRISSPGGRARRPGPRSTAGATAARSARTRSAMPISRAKGGRRWVMYAGVERRQPGAAGMVCLADPPDRRRARRALPPPPKFLKAATPNLTGTAGAYRPAGALERGGRRAAASGDYQPWTPD